MKSLYYYGVGDDDAKRYGVRPGLYFFGGKGDVAAVAPLYAPETCSEVSLSPGGKILAVDSGAWLASGWSFFERSSVKPLADTMYCQSGDNPPLLWKGDDKAFFSSVEMDDQKRNCDYDKCGPVSALFSSFKTQKAKALLKGTNLCDFNLTGFSPETGEVDAD